MKVAKLPNFTRTFLAYSRNININSACLSFFDFLQENLFLLSRMYVSHTSNLPEPSGVVLSSPTLSSHAGNTFLVKFISDIFSKLSSKRCPSCDREENRSKDSQGYKKGTQTKNIDSQATT